MKEKRQKPPLGVAQSRVLRTRILYKLYIKYNINSIYGNKGYVFFFGSSIATVAQRVHLFIQNRKPGAQGQIRVQWLWQQKRFRVQGVRRKA